MKNLVRRCSLVCVCLAASPLLVFADPTQPSAEAPAKVEPKITPGQVIVPSRMRRIWGELISLDPKNRTGKFRNQSTDEVMEFEVMPYAELLHHAAGGDLQDYIVGERAIFRLHEDEAGVWRHLTYIQDEMNFFLNHGEWYFIDAIDRDSGAITVHQAKADESFVREKDVVVHVDKDTKFWQNGQPTSFDALKVGDKFQTKARGTGKGQGRIAWHVFLDTDSLLKFQGEQQKAHAQRMRDEGLPGYVDAVSNGAGSDGAGSDGAGFEGAGSEGTVELTLFRHTSDWAKSLKPGVTARLASAGPDRQAQGKGVEVTVVAAKMQGTLCKVTVKPSSALPEGLQPTGVARLFVPSLFQ